MNWQGSWDEDYVDPRDYAVGLLDAKKIGSGFKAPAGVVGSIGQGIAEAISGGRPKTFFLGPDFRFWIKADIYVDENDSVTEVKTGKTRIKDYQISFYQKGLFGGGISVMFVQNPFSGVIGPDILDYVTLRQRNVPYSQVWFTGLNESPAGRKANESKPSMHLRSQVRGKPKHAGHSWPVADLRPG